MTDMWESASQKLSLTLLTIQIVVLVGNRECNTKRGFKNQLYIELGVLSSQDFQFDVQSLWNKRNKNKTEKSFSHIGCANSVVKQLKCCCIVQQGWISPTKKYLKKFTLRSNHDKPPPIPLEKKSWISPHLKVFDKYLVGFKK